MCIFTIFESGSVSVLFFFNMSDINSADTKKAIATDETVVAAAPNTTATAVAPNPVQYVTDIIDKNKNNDLKIVSLRVTVDRVSKFCLLCCCEPFARMLFQHGRIVFSTRMGNSRYFVKGSFEEESANYIREHLDGSLVFIAEMDDGHCGVILQEKMRSLCVDPNCFAPRCVLPNLSMIYRVLFLLICQREEENRSDTPRCDGFQYMVTGRYGTAVEEVRSPGKVRSLVNAGLRNGAPTFITKTPSESDFEDEIAHEENDTS